MGDQRKRARSEALSMVTNVIVIAVAVIVLLRPNTSVRAWWQERSARIETVAAITEAWPELTEEGARVGATHGGGPVIVEFADYECPYCKISHEAFQSLLTEHPDLTLVYRHLPLFQIHPRALDAARASICAEHAGFFQDMHNFLYETDAWKVDPNWQEIARGLGVPRVRTFVECLSSSATEERLARDSQLAQRLKLRSTPSFLGPGGVHTGALDEQSLNRILDRQSGAYAR